MNVIPILLLISNLFNSHIFTEYTDLEKEPDEFVLETKQIHLKDYPDAFNPSIIRYEGRLLLIFRIRDPILHSTDKMGALWLDEDFNQDSPIYPVIFNHGQERSMAQDPRLIILNDDLFIAFNDTLDSPQKHIRRMFIAKLEFNGQAFFAENIVMLKSFENEQKKRHEKNWVPFIYHDNLLLTYSLKPHTIFLPLIHENKCLTVSSTNTLCEWDFGEMRGGTQAFLVDGQYLAFFHSSKDIATLQSNGKKITHYFMGAYIFDKDPPFKITKMSKKPIIGKNFYNGKTHKTWKPLRVVFPGGFVFNDQHLFLAYGRQDHEIWIVKMDKKKLLKSLKKVN